MNFFEKLFRKFVRTLMKATDDEVDKNRCVDMHFRGTRVRDKHDFTEWRKFKKGSTEGEKRFCKTCLYTEKRNVEIKTLRFKKSKNG